jgi:histidyl-tRNA synthetase
MDIDFKNSKNIRIYESRTNDGVDVYVDKGILNIGLKKLKVHRRNVSRIEFTLEYIRVLNTKFQISKQYIRKCNFYSKFAYEIESISTPMVDKSYKNSY